MAKGELQTTDNNNIPRVISPGPDRTYLKTARGLKVTSGTLTIDASSWMMAYKVA